MVATYRCVSTQTDFAANKCMISVFNENASTNIIRVYRIWALNNQIAAVPGVITNLEIRKLSAASGGTTLNITKHNTSSSTLSNITCATNATVTTTDLYKRIIWSTDEPASAGTIDELQTLFPLALIWNQGYADSTTEPLTLRANQGVGIINTGAIAGRADFIIEFTVAGS